MIKYFDMPTHQVLKRSSTEKYALTTSTSTVLNPNPESLSFCISDNFNLIYSLQSCRVIVDIQSYNSTMDHTKVFTIAQQVYYKSQNICMNKNRPLQQRISIKSGFSYTIGSCFCFNFTLVYRSILSSHCNCSKISSSKSAYMV